MIAEIGRTAWYCIAVAAGFEDSWGILNYWYLSGIDWCWLKGTDCNLIGKDMMKRQGFGICLAPAGTG